MTKRVGVKLLGIWARFGAAAALLACPASTTATSRSNVVGFVPRAAMSDVSGAPLHLNGLGIRRIGDRYFAWAETHDGGPAAIACYSSPDLARWWHEADALLRTPSGDLGPDRVIERAKVLFNRPTGRYVLYFHADDRTYSEAKVGIAISDRPCGPYRYLGSLRPLGHESRDIGVFEDEDGRGYLLSEDRPAGTRIYALSQDGLRAEREVALLADRTPPKSRIGPGYEAPVLVHYQGTYYLFGSDLTGWQSNENRYATAPALGGPWSAWRVLAADPGSRTYDTQIAAVLPVTGRTGTAFVYMGDRWREHDLARSQSIWLPLAIGNGVATLRWRDRWSLDLLRGRVDAAPRLIARPAAAAALADVGARTGCVACSVGSLVQGLSPRSTLTFDGHGDAAAIAIRYRNEGGRDAHLTVNIGGHPHRLSLPPTAAWEQPIGMAVLTPNPGETGPIMIDQVDDPAIGIDALLLIGAAGSR